MDLVITIAGALLLVSASIISVSTVLWVRDRIPEIQEALRQITESISMIAESKRLSTVLTIEAKKGLGIKPEEFEPKKEEVRQSMLDALEETAPRYTNKKGRIVDSDTLAYVVLNKAGFDNFVESDVRQKAKGALARLLANQNIPAAKRFITTLARNL